jgi:hypothetical protein
MDQMIRFLYHRLSWRIESSFSSESTANNDVDFSPEHEDRTPQLFTQIELNDLVRDLGLTKEKS